MATTMADPFLSALFQVLFDRLNSAELLEFVHKKSIRSELTKWERMMEVIAEVLIDAEEKQLTDGAVKRWLDNIRDLAYDAEDILDDLATEAGKKSMEEHRSNTRRRGKTVPSCFTGVTLSAPKSKSKSKFWIRMESDIKDVSIRLKGLVDQKDDLPLSVGVGGKSSVADPKPVSTSLPTELAIYGRDEDKAKIVEMVLRDEPNGNSFNIISIVGAGGIGKTTLAREVYNDKLVTGYFNLRVWICASDDFDVFRISNAILESLTHSSGHLISEDFKPVQVQLEEEIAGKKFLLVLDDVWSRNYALWVAFLSPFQAGAPGSKIIVTTRDANVLESMGSIDGHNFLMRLSNDDCWSVFATHAFEDRDIDANGKMELIRKKVIEKCRGLPLAARILGGLLRSKQIDDDWEDILTSKIWEMHEESDILSVLKISYHLLPSYLKRCFVYCAIFPKNYEFNKEELVLLWIAEGLIPTSKTRRLEDLGDEYFRDLLSRSIFQQLNNNHDRFIMHDLVHDMAQWASGELCFRLESELGANEQSKRFEKTRHFSCTTSCYDSKNKFEVLDNVEHLRTFLPLYLDGHFRYVPDIVISHLFAKFKNVRVLSLSRYYIIEIPSFIGVLKHLRYLDFSYTQIRSLPDSVSSLYNLETLILTGCSSLMKLPSTIGKLINLRHLDIRGASLISEMPLGMKRLKYLQTLSNFIVNKGVKSGLKVLRDLNFLRGELCISGSENVIDSHEIKDSILCDKKDLRTLLLQWGSLFDDSRDAIVEENVLEMLQPPENLRELIIRCYGGTKFPSWLGNPVFSDMVSLTFDSCTNCPSLPPFGRLPLLKDLTIKGMTQLKSIGSEFYGENWSNPFPSLESLCFVDLDEWSHWNTVEEYVDAESFPHLRRLLIIRCPKLSGRLPDYLPLLKELVIHGCSNLVVLFSRLPMLCDLQIDGCKRMVCNGKIDFSSLSSVTLANISEFGTWLNQGFQMVRNLKIVNCEELVHLWQNQIHPNKPTQWFHSLTSVRELCIENLPGLVSFPEAEFFSILLTLQIENCDAMISLPEGIKHSHARLESLQIGGCHSLTFITRDQPPSSLKKLDIKNCDKLQCVFDVREDTCTSLSSSSSSSLLEYLYISECPTLTCLSTGGQPLVALKHLEIWDCSELTTLSKRGTLPETLQHLDIVDCPKLELAAESFHNNISLRYIKLCECKILKSIPDSFHNLSNLREIYIWNCPNLVAFPEEGLPGTSLRAFSILKCKKLKALPNHMHNLDSLQELEIQQCPRITSIQEGLPINLTSLSIADLNIYEPLIEWGLHKLSSLRKLEIKGCPYVVSFPPKEIGMMLPTSLTGLTIARFSELKYLSSEGFQNLTSLESLTIIDCPHLTSFPAVRLPSSLLQLYIYNCPLLRKQGKRNEGNYSSKLALIPRVRVIYESDQQDEEGALLDLRNDEENRMESVK